MCNPLKIKSIVIIIITTIILVSCVKEENPTKKVLETRVLPYTCIDTQQVFIC